MHAGVRLNVRQSLRVRQRRLFRGHILLALLLLLLLLLHVLLRKLLTPAATHAAALLPLQRRELAVARGSLQHTSRTKPTQTGGNFVGDEIGIVDAHALSIL